MEDQAKRQLLQSLIEQVDTELYRTEIEKLALDAEIGAITEESTVNSIKQQEVNQAEYAQRLRARRATYEQLLQELPAE